MFEYICIGDEVEKKVKVIHRAQVHSWPYAGRRQLGLKSRGTPTASQTGRQEPKEERKKRKEGGKEGRKGGKEGGREEGRKFLVAM